MIMMDLMTYILILYPYVNGIRSAHNNVTIGENNHDNNLIHNCEVEENDPTNNDQEDDNQFVNNDDDTLGDDGV